MNPSTAPAAGTRATQAGRGSVAALSSRTFHVFRVRVSTGDAAGAGTDSRVFLTLMGTAGHSAEMELLDSLAGDDKFERGNTDEFAVRISKDVGDITRIVLRSDASSLGSDWLVSRVVITNCQNNNQYTFECHDCWIRDTMPHEFICSERIKRDLQLENVSDNSGLLLSARSPISGAQGFHITSLARLPFRFVLKCAAGGKDELLDESGSAPFLNCHHLLNFGA
jgi:hypothetical protein